MTKLQILIAGCMMLTVSATAFSQAPPANPPEQEALFVGNSYYDFYVIPNQVAAMCQNVGITFRSARETKGGFNLERHWNEGNARERIQSEGPWTFVVLQDGSRRSLDTRPLFDQYIGLFIQHVREHSKAEPILYLTWARKQLPHEQAAITEAYCTLALKHNVRVAPVGVAFQKWMEKYPEQILLRDDKASHPTELGAYLSACVFYATLTGQSPVGQLHRIEGYNWLTKGDVLVDLDEALARQVQELAWETVQGFEVTDYARPQ